ncbi:von Willebrand factor type A domain protein [Sulfitobacter sp. THAF37]|uniref:TadE/TadG family type IV pilus assembly protein n=1 Tax=Sulfitobacter sp. THAF37 TaxID=2587855 RepID=UPI0012684577|nr:TadE/TadG family type IV pilus assembly protein [Sulfitobacter sp. THAF37]QFT58014.1 von Willebrand factor type A domain protein [Sulfitobacter sp. THAF37]
MGPQPKPAILTAATPRLRRFARREEGAITIFACFMVIIMLMVGGISVDMMRHEMDRSRLQAAADRAVLAAAALNQRLAPEDVVSDYLTKSGIRDYVSDVEVSEGLSFRTVTVGASTTMATQFMDYLGVETLNVPARATAEDRVPNVEISLVLDISGSMRFSNRMNDLRPAAAEFLDIVLDDANRQKTSVTLVPYAGQTNPGPFMFDRLNGARYPATPLDEADGGIPEDLSHGQLPADAEGGSGSDPNIRYVYPNVSSCLDIGTDGFGSAALPSGILYPQTPHFMNWTIAGNVMDWGWCPQDQTAIQYLSNDRTGLKALIDTMRMHDGTGTHYAMKWAVSMLDPSSQDEVVALANAGLAPAEFVGRPASYDDPTTQKYIILMTDGQITEQVRPIDMMDPENPVRELQRGRQVETEIISSAGTNVGSFFQQCDLAKSRSPRPIVIYTIAFEAPGVPEQQMRDCASSPSHFFSADGDNIADVFEAIAYQIRQLRLTQ